MKTRTAIFEVFPNGRSVGIRAGRKEGERVELSVSPARALAMYQVLTGRRDAVHVRVFDRDRGEAVSVRMHVFKKEEKEEGKRILVWRGEQGVLALLLKNVGSLALAEEIRSAIRSVVDGGGLLEVGGEDFYVLADAVKVRVAYKSAPVSVQRKYLYVVRSAMERGMDLEGLIGVKGGHLTVKDRQVQGKEGELLKSVVEVLT